MAIQSQDVSRHGMWSTPLVFILASTGSAVGLGNIWKFPYVAGENGGGAFIMVYLVSILLLGIPIMTAEVLLGREGRHSPIGTMRRLIAISNTHRAWVLIGWSGAIAGFLIFSYYEVIAGWTLSYAVDYASQLLFPSEEIVPAQTRWNNLQASPLRLILFQAIFIVITIRVVGRGVSKGLEVVSIWFVPLLFLILLMLLVYSMWVGDFTQGAEYIFTINWQALGINGVLAAVGQAFFTLSLGMGAMMVYGAYLPTNASIPKVVFTVALLDTLVAVVAGLIIFSIVFANGLEPSGGPGLFFISLSSAFDVMPGGALVGTLFFTLVVIAALTSLISLTEPAVSWLVEQYNVRRARITLSLGVLGFLAGLGTVFSFNLWSELHLVGSLTFFETIDYFTSNILLPVGGFFIALFAGWLLPKEVLRRQLRLSDLGLVVWQLTTRWVAPAGVLLVFCYTLYQSLIN